MYHFICNKPLLSSCICPSRQSVFRPWAKVTNFLQENYYFRTKYLVAFVLNNVICKLNYFHGSRDSQWVCKLKWVWCCRQWTCPPTHQLFLHDARKVDLTLTATRFPALLTRQNSCDKQNLKSLLWAGSSGSFFTKLFAI